MHSAHPLKKYSPIKLWIPSRLKKKVLRKTRVKNKFTNALNESKTHVVRLHSDISFT